MPSTTNATAVSASTNVVSQQDVESLLGITMSESQILLFERVNNGVERQIERELGGQPLLQPEAPFVELLPGADFTPEADPLLTQQRRGGVYAFREPAHETLDLSRGIVRTLVDVRVDHSRAFPDETQLSIGTDCYLDIDQSDYGEVDDPISLSGLVYSVGGWPTTPRSVRITYTAGLTSTELAGPYYDLKFAVMEEVARRMKGIIQSQGVGATSFPIQSENIGGQHSVSYAIGSVTTNVGELGSSLKNQLRPFVRWNLG